MAGPMILVFMGCFTLTLGQHWFQPIAYTLPTPRILEGALAPNNALLSVERLHAGRVFGPVAFAFLNGNVYTVTSDGKVLNIATCIPQLIANLRPPNCNSYSTCGVLVSIKVGRNGLLMVLDAYRGLFEVNPYTGAIRWLFSGANIVDGRRPKYLNDMVQASNGNIYIADSSDKFEITNDLYIIMEGRTSGRCLEINITAGTVREFIGETVAYPNGLELTVEGDALLVAEAGRARILRISLNTSGQPQPTIFADNLPGVPTSIRRSNRGTHWVSLSLVRHRGIPNSMDEFSNNPLARFQTVLRDSLEKIRSYYPYYGLVLELSANGTILRSFHDPSGWTYTGVSEAAENEGLLYVGSSQANFVGRIVLPQTGGSVLTADGTAQLQRSRCQISEQAYQQYLKTKTTTATITPGESTTGVTTSASPNGATDTGSTSFQTSSPGVALDTGSTSFQTSSPNGATDTGSTSFQTSSPGVALDTGSTSFQTSSPGVDMDTGSTSFQTSSPGVATDPNVI